MSEYYERSADQSSQVLYPSSWIDHLVAWIDRMPIPAWLTYTLCVLCMVILINVVFWIDGSMPFGAFNLTNTIFAPIIIYWVGLYHYLSVVASRSMRKFRPLLDADDSEIAKINHELVILPRWIGWLTIPLGLGLSIIMESSDPAPFGDIVPHTLFPFVGDIIVTGFLLSAFLCLAIRSIRQLRLVSKLHNQATHINLLKLEPAHAFAALTSRAGIGIILLVVFSIPLDPTPLGSSLDIFMAGVTLLLAVAVFVLPVIGIRNHIDKERDRVLDDINDLIEATSEQLHEQVRSNNYQTIGNEKDALEALILERGLVQKIPTWPWDSSTLRIFVTALLLPIVLQLLTRLLERLLSL